jgi:transketolase
VINPAKPMRVIFGEILSELGSDYPQLAVLDGDVSSSTQTKIFGQKYPERFYNFGIAEANMVSAAAGMAACGLIPVASTFAFLMTFRAGDPVRSLIAYNRLNVKLAGGYAGLSDFADGASHQSVLDLAVMRAMPNMTVLVPSDIDTTKGAIKAMLDYHGPVYLRLSRDLVTAAHGGDTDFSIGNARILKDGGEITLVVSGTLLLTVLAAAEQLARYGIDAAVVEYPTLKPFDHQTIRQYAAKTKAVITVEEHSIIGGLGSAVAESLGEQCPTRLCRIGLRDSFGESGAYQELLKKHGLSAEAIVDAAKKLLNRQ